MPCPTHDMSASGRQLAAARAKSKETYDRRRARDFAEGLVTIAPDIWDAATRQIIITLAALVTPSAIDDALHAFDGQPADTMVEIHGQWATALGDVPGALCASLHHHGTLEQAKACDDLPRAYPRCKWGSKHSDAEMVAICDAFDTSPHKDDCPPAMHDNGDYRA